jgi:hypothetical protein
MHRLRSAALLVLVCLVGLLGYAQAPAAPTFSLASGTYTTLQKLTITGTGALHYTVDGSTPTSSSTVYDHPLAVGVTETVKAVAVSGGLTSAVTNRSYTLNTKTVFSLSTTASGVSPTPFPPLNRFCCGETWNNLEPSSGSFPNWGLLDGWVSQTQAHPGSVSMYTFNHTPTWANGTSGVTDPPNDIIAGKDFNNSGDSFFKGFVTAFMKHTCGVGSQPSTPLVGVCSVKYIEMWNEFNTDVYFTNGTYQQLATMSNDAATIIREYCGDCYVVAGSVSAGGDGFHSSGQSGVWYTALEQYLAAWGAIPNATLPDMVSFHAYPARTNVSPAPFPTTIKSNSSSICSTNTSSISCRTAIKDQVNTISSSTVLLNSSIASWAAHLPILMTEGAFGLDTSMCDGSDCTQGHANVNRLRGAYAAQWALMLAQQPGLLQATWYAYNEPSWGTLETGGATNYTYSDLMKMTSWLSSAAITGPATSTAVTGGNVWRVPLTISGQAAEIHFYDGWLSPYVEGVSYATQQTLDGVTRATGGSVTLTQEPVLLTSPAVIPVAPTGFSGKAVFSGTGGAPPGGATGNTYYISATGSDTTGNGTSSAPWASPNHSNLVCGDIIIAQPSTSYNFANFGAGKWHTVSCPTRDSVVWVKCATFDGCKISAGAHYGFFIDQSYWGVSGWEVTTAANGFTCFAMSPSGAADIHHIIFANDIASGCGGGGFGGFNSGTHSVDYIAFVGDLAYNAAQNPLNCYSGFTVFQPKQTDTLPGTHIYFGGNFAYKNVDSPTTGGCGGSTTTTTDGEGLILDTFDGYQGLSGTFGVPLYYTQQVVAANNLFVGNGGRGLEYQTYKKNATAWPKVYRYNNTMYGNSTDTHQNTTLLNEMDVNIGYGVVDTANIADSTVASINGNTVFAYSAYDESSAKGDSVSGNWFYAVSGSSTSHFNDDTLSFTFGSNVTGVNPAFKNPVIPSGAPSCGLASSVVDCMQGLIDNFTPTASNIGSYGYQKVTGINGTDSLFPQWLCTSNLPLGLVDMSCPGAGATFTPAAGQYGTSQSVSISVAPSPGVSLFYTTDGSTPSSAATLYTGPITVSSDETVQVHAESTGVVAQNTGTSSAKWKCVTVGGGTWGSLTCDSGGGVGSFNPTNVTWSWGSTMAETVSTTASSGETQILYVYTDNPCNDCTTISQDKWLESVGDDTIIANNELDMMQYDGTRSRLHMFGLQCNQQPGNAAFGHWQIDNQQGIWWTTNITDSCPLPTSSYTHIVYEGHWSLSDTTGCSGSTQYNNNGVSTGYGCEHFDALTINDVRYPLNVVMNSYTEPGWGAFCGNQDQIDLTNTTQSGHNPTTGGRNVQKNNVTCGYGVAAVGDATYTIP